MLAPGHWQSLYNEVVVLAFGLRGLDEAQKVLDELQQAAAEQPRRPASAEAVEQQRSAA